MTHNQWIKRTLGRPSLRHAAGIRRSGNPVIGGGGDVGIVNHGCAECRPARLCARRANAEGPLDDHLVDIDSNITAVGIDWLIGLYLVGW